MKKHNKNRRLGISAALVVGLALASASTMAVEYLAANTSEYQHLSQQLKPGDVIVLKNGVWTDFEIVFEGHGTAQKPITLTAQEKGKVVLSGQSSLKMAGEHLVVSGLVFRDGHTAADSVIAFRKNKTELANHSRVTETVIDHYSNPERFETDYWVSMYGKYNRFDHNHLEGKSNKGVTMAVRLNSQASLENHHRIDHNYFGPRATLGSNGGETLRVGTSHYSLFDSFTVIENNFFDRCDGEVEIVSIKSGGNEVRGNVFFESRGTLTLRHGNGNVLEGNVFLGNGVAHTGGIRVINKRQTIRNNYFEGLKGYRFGGAFVVMNGVPNSPINRYHSVEDTVMENNSIINSDHIELAAGSDAERSEAPSASRFSQNLITHDVAEQVFTVHDDISGIRFAGNVVSKVSAEEFSEGFVSASVDLKRADNGLLFPADASLADVGASRSLNPVSKEQTGTDWYPKPDRRARFGTGEVIDVPPGVDSLTNALIRADEGDVLRLAPGNHTVTKILVIDKPLSVVAGGAATVDFERSTLFEIADGGSLQLRGLTITGKNAPDYNGNSVIRTSRYSMLQNYELSIEDCELIDLDVNRFFNVFSVSKSTMADRISIARSRFSDVSGAILKLDLETDDYGIYNAEYVSISDSSFRNVQGALVDLYRGGTDESTFGPHFSLRNSELENVGTGGRNKSKASVHLHGVQVATIAGNRFFASAPIAVMHTVAEPITAIEGNIFAQTAGPTVLELHSDKTSTASIRNNQYINN